MKKLEQKIKKLKKKHKKAEAPFLKELNKLELELFLKNSKKLIGKCFKENPAYVYDLIKYGIIESVDEEAMRLIVFVIEIFKEDLSFHKMAGYSYDIEDINKCEYISKETFKNILNKYLDDIKNKFK